jgi:phosphoglycolate phosphatase-like HAD superfamily hydrolase
MRELGRTISLPRLEALGKRHGELSHRFPPKPRPLPGEVELLRLLRQNKVIHGIATCNRCPHFDPSLNALGVTQATAVVGARGWPEPSPGAWPR